MKKHTHTALIHQISGEKNKNRQILQQVVKIKEVF